MAKRTKIKKISKQEKPSDRIDNKKRIAGVLMVVLSLIIFLSVVSYSSFDKAQLTNSFSDIFSLQTENQINKDAHSIYNWMGVTGAYISDFFITSTIGYFSLVFPFLLFLWGVSFFLPIDFNKKIKVTNLSLVFSLIGASVFGVLSSEYGFLKTTIVLSGAVGTFLGSASGVLLGGIGSLLFFLTVTISIFVLFFNFKVENFFFKTKSIIDKTSEAGKEKLSSLTKPSSVKAETKSEETPTAEATPEGVKKNWSVADPPGYL